MYSSFKDSKGLLWFCHCDDPSLVWCWDINNMTGLDGDVMVFPTPEGNVTVKGPWRANYKAYLEAKYDVAEEPLPTSCAILYTEEGNIRMREFDTTEQLEAFVGKFTLHYMDNPNDNQIEAYIAGSITRVARGIYLNSKEGLQP